MSLPLSAVIHLFSRRLTFCHHTCFFLLYLSSSLLHAFPLTHTLSLTRTNTYTHTHTRTHPFLSLTGIGSNEKSVVSSTEYDKNRIEVLRVMIAAFSDSLYQVLKSSHYLTLPPQETYYIIVISFILFYIDSLYQVFEP